MIAHVCSRFVAKYGIVQEDMGQLRLKIMETPKARTSELTPTLRKNYSEEMNWLAGECGWLDLKHSERMARSICSNLQRKKHRYTLELMLQEYERLSDTLRVELSERKFAFIPPPYDKYFEQEQLFGDKVFKLFEAARSDIKDAGNALAASLPTASVYHLMRVTEHGLRRLAKKLRVTLTHSGKPMPIEFGDWDKVITGIKNEIAKARSLPRGPRRQTKLEMYSNAADHCEYMKDVWRNNTAHVRRPWKQAEAVGVMNRVRNFMQFLGEHL